MNRLTFLLCLLVFGGWDWAIDTAWARSAPKPTRAGLSVQSVGSSDFERAILSELMRRYGRPHHQVTLRVLFPKEALRVPKGKLHLEVQKIAGGGRMGRQAFRVGVFVNSQFIKTVNVIGELKARVKVPAPTRWIKPREIVAADDLVVMTVDVPSLSHDFVLDPRAVIGKQVLRPLSPRQPIRKIMLDDPPVIRKGDRVIIEVRRGGLLVQTVGLAKAAGKNGEMIPVKNRNSGREVLGTVMAAGLVEVRF